MKLSARQLCACALMAAFTGVCSQIQIPLPPVPVNLALLGVFLSGLVLGPRLGALTLGAYLLMGLAGLPLFAGLQGGPGALFGPTGGYLMSYLPCAWLTGRLRHKPIAAMAAGLLIVYLGGSVFYSLTTHTPYGSCLALCVLPFIPGDLIKMALALTIARRMKKVWS